jgi:hypothetical protein
MLSNGRGPSWRVGQAAIPAGHFHPAPFVLGHFGTGCCASEVPSCPAKPSKSEERPESECMSSAVVGIWGFHDRAATMRRDGSPCIAGARRILRRRSGAVGMNCAHHFQRTRRSMRDTQRAGAATPLSPAGFHAETRWEPGVSRRDAEVRRGAEKRKNKDLEFRSVFLHRSSLRLCGTLRLCVKRSIPLFVACHSFIDRL